MPADDASSATDSATAGYHERFPGFVGANVRHVRSALEAFVHDASDEERRSWSESIPKLQQEAREVCDVEPRAPSYTAVLEYQLPYDSRRADAVFLVAGGVLVIELKGRADVRQAHVDQAAAYARDLRAYHRSCHVTHVAAVLVPTRATAPPEIRDGVWVCGPEHLDRLVAELALSSPAEPVRAAEFLDPEAYSPLPTLVQAARELFERREIRAVWRARAATEPAVDRIADIAHEAARTRTRRLVLVTGVPGSGKTLVGLRAVHARYLDDLAITRARGQPAVPALFLSGNGPLVAVMQHVLGGAGGGRVFVRHIKQYLDAHVPRPARVPDEHVLVFDEAQRAFSPDMVAAKHPKWSRALVASEPELFIRVCDRIPEWCVLIGLIGTGQEIYVGEEGGLAQWRDALLRSSRGGEWTVHAAQEIEQQFGAPGILARWEPALNLNTELRFHVASELHDFVRCLLDDAAPGGASLVAERLWSPRNRRSDGLRLWATRDLEVAKSYARERYSGQPEARYGLLASSRDKSLAAFGIPNDYPSTKTLRIGPWVADGPGSPHSCCNLATCATEFDVQGLELDLAVLGWGTDLVRHGGLWSTENARGYKRGGVQPRDPTRLRLNSYRVLLTRGRDGTVVFVPKLGELDETWDHLLASGFRELD